MCAQLLTRAGLATRRVAFLAAALAGPALLPAQAPDVSARLASVRDAAALRPMAALSAIARLREAPAWQHDLRARLSIDEVECRVRSDFDVPRALAVADAGLALAGDSPTEAAREAWIRLRACRAGMLVEAGSASAAHAEFDRLFRLTDAEPESAARGLVLLERGVMRSRAGEYESGQADLQSACTLLARTGPARDRQLCLAHLANHYRRVGDLDESLRLLQPLRDAARRAGEQYDEAIYEYAIAQALELEERWSESLAAFREAADVNMRMGEMVGVSYAEQAMARSLARLGRPLDALAAVDRALARFDHATDPRHAGELVIARAELLVTLGHPTEARAELVGIEAPVRARGNAPMLESWLRASARASGASGEWQAAYTALAEAEQVESRLDPQRRSEQAARLRARFNRARDAEELATLRQLNVQGQELRRTQAVALGLFVGLLALALALVLRKVRQARRLQQLASTDELTGVANRRALMAWLGQAFDEAKASGRPMAVLMIDADHFKRVNDTHGHSVGDEMLRHLVGVLGHALRGADRLGRLGGEEFAVVLPGTTLSEARLVAERMRMAVVDHPLRRPEGEVALTVSIGVAAGQGAAHGIDVLTRADAALYRAKSWGRNRVVVHEQTGPGLGDLVARPGHPAPRTRWRRGVGA